MMFVAHACFATDQLSHNWRRELVYSPQLIGSKRFQLTAVPWP
jgi:hypothetical protein